MHLGKRLASHIMGCDSSRDRRVRKNIWLTEILKAGFVPGIKVIERIDNGISWELSEIKWIAHYRQILGDSLLNVSIGAKVSAAAARKRAMSKIAMQAQL